MIDYGMVWWHLTGFILVVTVVMILAKMVFTDLHGFPRFVLFCLVVAGTWYAHTNYYIQSGSFLRDTVLAPFLGKRSPAERLSYAMESKAWKDPDIRKELQNVSVLERAHRAIELGNAGIFRLSDARQLRWLELSGHLFELGQDAECSAMMNGTLSLDTIFRMFNRLSEADIREYYEITLEAVSIGAKPGSPPAPPTADPTAVMRTLVTSVPANEQVRFRSAAMSANLGGQRDLCWFGKIVFEGIGKLPQSSRVALLQSLTARQPQAAPPGPMQARRL